MNTSRKCFHLTVRKKEQLGRVIEGKTLTDLDKNKNEDWSSVWSSLLLQSEFSEHVHIPIITLSERGHTHVFTHVKYVYTCVYANRHLYVKKNKSVNVEGLTSEEGVMKFQVREEQRF